jgi:hypothetical protein
MGAVLTIFTLAAIVGALAYDVTEEDRMMLEKEIQHQLEPPADEHAADIDATTEGIKAGG